MAFISGSPPPLPHLILSNLDTRKIPCFLSDRDKPNWIIYRWSRNGRDIYDSPFELFIYDPGSKKYTEQLTIDLIKSHIPIIPSKYLLDTITNNYINTYERTGQPRSSYFRNAMSDSNAIALTYGDRNLLLHFLSAYTGADFKRVILTTDIIIKNQPVPGMRLDIVPAAPAQNLKIIGSGAFGVAVSPAISNINERGAIQEFPKNVTKVFFKKEALDKALNEYKRLPELFGMNNAGHKAYTYRRHVKAKNLPRNVRAILNSKSILRNSNNLHLMRMPNLGVDMFNILNDPTDTYTKPLQNVPVSTILREINKLINQIESLGAKGYGHFDIRAENIMVNPTSGAITLIDFDFINRFDNVTDDGTRAKLFGLYHFPPESLMAKLRGYYLPRDIDKNDILSIINSTMSRNGNQKTLMTYIDTNFLNATAYHWQMILKYNLRDTSKIYNDIKNSIFNLIDYVNAHHHGNYAKFIKEDIKTYDGYALAMCLLSFLYKLYPAAFDSHANKGVSEYRRTLTKAGTPYSDVELNAFATAIQATISTLKQMCDIDYMARMKIGPAKLVMNRILRDFNAAVGITVTNDLDLIPNNVATSTEAAGGAGAVAPNTAPKRAAIRTVTNTLNLIPNNFAAPTEAAAARFPANPFVLIFDYDGTLIENHTGGDASAYKLADGSYKPEISTPVDQTALRELVKLSETNRVVILTRAIGDTFEPYFKWRMEQIGASSVPIATNIVHDDKRAIFNQSQITIIAPSRELYSAHSAHTREVQLWWAEWKYNQLLNFVTQFKYYPRKTIFTDDTPDNVNSAKMLFYLDKGNSIHADQGNPVKHIEAVTKRISAIRTVMDGGNRKKTRKTRHRKNKTRRTIRR